MINEVAEVALEPQPSFCEEINTPHVVDLEKELFAASSAYKGNLKASLSLLVGVLSVQGRAGKADLV